MVVTKEEEEIYPYIYSYSNQNVEETPVTGSSSSQVLAFTTTIDVEETLTPVVSPNDYEMYTVTNVNNNTVNTDVKTAETSMQNIVSEPSIMTQVHLDIDNEFVANFFSTNFWILTYFILLGIPYL